MADVAGAWLRQQRRLLAWALVASAALLVMPGVASASKGVVDMFGQAGSGAGEFTFAGGTAINQATGDVYVADADCCGLTEGGQRIQQFTATGEFVRTWGWGVATGAEQFEVCTVSCRAGIPGAGDGQFMLNADSWFPQITVDQADGSVYVADNGNNRVQKFSATGTFLGAFGSAGNGDGQLAGALGVAVDPVTGDVYVADTDNNRVQRFDADGNYLSQFGGPGGAEGPLARPWRVAVDSTGRVYVLDTFNSRVLRYTDAGAFDGAFAEGLVSSPTDVAVDPADDHVYIVGSNADFSITGVLEFDGDGTPVDAHASPPGASLSAVAVRSSTRRLYAPDWITDQVLIFDEVVAPAVSMDSVADVDAYSAVFHGRVNPQGPPSTAYRFEYSVDGSSWVCVPDPACDPASDIDIGDGVADVVVSQTASGLKANTEYRARLVASKAFGAARGTSAELTFTTDAAPPLVRARAAGTPTANGVWLGGEVNAQNSQTSYYVEYALADDTAYADSGRVPADDVDVGDGNDYVVVRQLAAGLQPGTAYRFRVVAENEAGTTNGPDRTFTTRDAPPVPPANRGYEMVSPLDKNGADIQRNIYAPNQGTSGAAASGTAVSFAALGQFAGIASGAPQGQYLSVRDEHGWRTRGITPPTMPLPNEATNESYVPFLSGDLSHAVVGTPFQLVPEAALLGGRRGLYLQDLSGSTLGYDLLSTPADQLSPALGGRTDFDFVGASSDMRHVVFDSDRIQLTPDGVPSLPGTRGVYEWANGQLRFVSMLPSGEPAPLAAAGANQASLGARYPGDHLVSDDGERIFFTAGTSSIGEPLYVREGGTVTRPVSASQRAGDDPEVAQRAIFRAARASDGRFALFTSSEKLTADATAPGGFAPCSVSSCRDDLYLWDAEAPVDERLTDLTTGDPQGGGVLNVVRAADDLSHVYFVATGELAEGAIAGRPNLYVWTRSDGVRHVAILDSQRDGGAWGVERDYGSEQFRTARVDGDGSRLVFESYAALTTSETDETKQIYLYDYEDDRLVCVSCPGGELALNGDSWLFFPTDPESFAYVDRPRMPYRLPRNISADGRRIFFETAQKLVDADTNGEVDVYMWDQGETSLVSTGESGEESEFLDASASGDDVFFLTRQPLVGADADDQVDVYDARVGGGFPEQELPPECVGDECQPPAPSPPSPPGPGSSTEGMGNVDSKRPSLSVARMSARQRRALAMGRRVSLLVRVNMSGRIVVRGVARIGKRLRAVAGARAITRRAAVVRLRLRLSRPARVALTELRRLRVSFEVRFAGIEDQRAVSLVAPSTNSKGGRRR